MKIKLTLHPKTNCIAENYYIHCWCQEYENYIILYQTAYIIKAKVDKIFNSLLLTFITQIVQSLQFHKSESMTYKKSP